jgi:hypothetical protein
MLMNKYAMGCFLKSLVMKPTFSLFPADQLDTTWAFGSSAMEMMSCGVMVIVASKM